MSGGHELQKHLNSAPVVKIGIGIVLRPYAGGGKEKSKLSEVKMSKLIDLTGKKFGMLIVVGRSPSIKQHTYWNCVCECGNNTSVDAYHLKRGYTKSCGCSSNKFISEKNSKHGLSKNPVYNTWHSMLNRCNNPNRREFSRYGGRGITVCQEWKDPEVFIKWALDAGWKQGLQIDRIDNDGNYCPENCRFVTNLQNSLNKSSMQSNNTSGFTGVNKHKKTGKYLASVKYITSRHIGTFSTAEEAIIARDQYIIDNNLPLRLQVLTRD